ncbi:DUF2637 domain-containing protein [Prauserella endophytica]|uniref:DUF2637 domain-containing protein n=1 Tax=Prauserella endophytica TaxID=1592324 RepID=A0ABY2RZ29_9PSEU|nr:DUF2637 domain-containing protein [Prauserella endophytica]TKG66195.1 DUF2637 domain-containing protein [Prauserella endophytica]
MRRSWITWTGLAVVAGAAAVLSFDALRQLAVLAGTPAGLAWLLPVCIDAAALVATRLWLTGDAPGAARRFARTLALTMIALSVGGNATSHALVAYQVTPPWWAVVAVAAVPPAVLGAVAHLAALAVTRQTSVDAPRRVDSAPEGHAQLVQHAGQAGDDLVDRARYLVAAGDAEGVKVGRGRLARELGISENQARGLLRQLESERRPSLRVAGGEAR